jgi:hypothetical protein
MWQTELQKVSHLLGLLNIWCLPLTHGLKHFNKVSAAFSERACAPCYDEKSPAKNDSANGQPSPPRFHFPQGMEESPDKQPDLIRCKIPSGMSMENSELGDGI